jgi:hypothetical protein
MRAILLASVIGGPGLLRMACARLMEDEVQGDQEGGLHGEDGHAGRDGDVALLHGPPFSDPWSGVRSARRKFCAARGSNDEQKTGNHSRPLRRSAWRRYHVRGDISSLSQGFLASVV